VGAEPLISVLLPARNAGVFLDAAVASVLAQTERRLELVAVNDGSMDDTGVRLERWARRDARVRVLTAGGLGPAGALNVAADAARGRYFARMDADDISLPSRLAEQLEALAASPRRIACGTWARTFGDAGRHTWRPPTTPGAARALLLFRSPLVHPTVMMPRMAVEAVQPLYRPEYGRAEDYDLWERLAGKGDLLSLPRVLLQYRTHPGQETVVARLSSEEGARRVRRRAMERWMPAVSAEMLELHDRVAGRRGADSADELRAADAWLGTLDRWNRTNPVASADEWRSVLAGVWWEYCRASSRLGVTTAAVFAGSRHHGRGAVPTIRWLRLVLATVRRNR
jgi:hypothetical protein